MRFLSSQAGLHLYVKHFMLQCSVFIKYYFQRVHNLLYILLTVFVTGMFDQQGFLVYSFPIGSQMHQSIHRYSL